MGRQWEEEGNEPPNIFDQLTPMCAPVFCDFVQNYSCTVDGAVVTLFIVCLHVQDLLLGKQDATFSLLQIITQKLVTQGFISSFQLGAQQGGPDRNAEKKL